MNVQNIVLIVDALVAESETDYVGFWQIGSNLNRYEEENDEQKYRNTVIAVARALILRGLKVGELGQGSAFVEWPDQNPERLLDQIKKKWEMVDYRGTIGDVCWFNNLSPRGAGASRLSRSRS
jgi:hypothetical protein